MFGMSPIELVVIVVASLLIFEASLPRLAAHAGRWAGKLKRNFWDS
jgi:Sec-independent protein translocase protein TatA